MRSRRIDNARNACAADEKNIMLQSNDTQQQQLCPIKLFPEVDDACEAARTQSIDPLLSLTGVMH